MKERKNKLTILIEIQVLLNNRRAYNRNQISNKIGSHWLTVRECLDYLISNNLIDCIQTNVD